MILYFEDEIEVGGWSKEDVISKAQEMGYDCTDEIATEVTSAIEHNFDASVGISWDTIEMELASYKSQNGKD